MIYTSYFSKIKNLDDSYIIIGVTRFPPSKFKNNISFIAPSEWLLYKYKNNKINEKEYEEIYTKELDCKIDLFLEYLKRIQTNNKHIVLCCYEKSEKFCHRHILAKELNKRGFDIKELE